MVWKNRTHETSGCGTHRRTSTGSGGRRRPPQTAATTKAVVGTDEVGGKNRVIRFGVIAH